jgi:hypothetical protein
MSHNSGGDHFSAAAEARMIAAQDRARNRNQRDDALAAAREAVVKTTMARWRYGSGDDVAMRDLDHARDTACAALAVLEAK